MRWRHSSPLARKASAWGLPKTYTCQNSCNVEYVLTNLLSKRYNSCRVLAFSTIFFHSWRSWACSVHLRSFIFLRSFLTSSSHLCLGLPTGRVIYGCHLCIFFTMLVSGFLYMCPYQLSLWALTYFIMFQSCINSSNSTGWARSHRTPREYAPQTQFKFTQHSTARSTM